MKAICSVLISGCLFLTSIYAVDYTSVQNGEWNNDATWDAAGYPDGSDDNVTIDGETVTASVNVVCGTLTMTSGTLTCSGSPTVTAYNTWNTTGGTFNAGGSTVVLHGGAYTITTGGAVFNNLKFDSPSSALTKTLADDFTVNGTLEVRGVNNSFAHYISASGTPTITLNGDYYKHDCNLNSGLVSTNITVSLTNDIDQTFTQKEGSGKFSAVMNLAKAGTGKLALDSDFSFGSGLTISSGQVLDTQGHNVTFGNTFSNVDSTTFLVGTGVTFQGSFFTITTGQITFSNLTFYGNLAGATLTVADDFTVNGTLEFRAPNVSYGCYVVPSGTRALTLNGDYNQHTLSTGGGAYFGNSGLTLIMQGASDQTFTRTHGYFKANFNVNKSSGSAILSNVSNGMTIVTGSSIIITNGTLDINGTNLTVATAGNFIVYGNGTFQWRGDESVTVPDLRAGSTVCFKGADSPVTVTNWSYKNLTIDAPGKTFLWTAGATYTVAEQFTVNGADGNLLILHSTTNDTQWNLNLTTLEGIAQYVSVRDSNAGGGEAVRDPLLKSVDEGNNINWFIAPPPRTVITFF